MSQSEDGSQGEAWFKAARNVQTPPSLRTLTPHWKPEAEPNQRLSAFCAHDPQQGMPLSRLSVHPQAPTVSFYKPILPTLNGMHSDTFFFLFSFYFKKYWL